MSKFSKIAGAAAAAALVLSVGVGSAAANVTRYHEPNGDVISINTPNVAAVAGTTTTAHVTVSVEGPRPLLIANEKFLTAYGWGDTQWDGLSFANYGCWARTLYPGQSCTSTINFTPQFIGTHNESYMIATGVGTRYANFTATGLRPYRVIAPPPSAGMLAP
ncbi:MAG: hypothetical protein JWL67_1129 [Solirubrobacterales bacterium]|jgi:hypothetical protein|nr:hypothetical protein [Solirubrobacterales bacterium]